MPARRARPLGPRTPSPAAWPPDGGLLVTRRDGLFHFIDGALTRLAPPPCGRPARSMTAGWPRRASVGGACRCAQPEAVLYVWTGSAEARVGGLHVSNGLACWSPDGAPSVLVRRKLHRIYGSFSPATGASGCLGSSPNSHSRWPDPWRPAGRAAVVADGAYWSLSSLRGRWCQSPTGGACNATWPCRSPAPPCPRRRRRPPRSTSPPPEKRPADELAREPWAKPGCPGPGRCAWAACDLGLDSPATRHRASSASSPRGD